LADFLAKSLLKTSEVWKNHSLRQAASDASSRKYKMNTSTSIKQTETKRDVVRWLIRETMGVLMLVAILFLSAGRWDWWMGWALVGITALWIGGTALVVIPRNPELLAERVGPRKGAKTWDTVIMSVVGLNMVAKYIVAGLDVRYGWTTSLSLSLQIAALIITALGYALVVWATAANAFFSQIVRIQKERGHTVVASGPYRFVRHPAYVGTILFELASSVMLGSWWALIPGGFSALLLVVRTTLEDKTLQAELDGYTEYAEHTRYRLLPGVW
jgi:protein-S-isoprenylcysteine O-methyltransferase Ste14